MHNFVFAIALLGSSAAILLVAVSLIISWYRTGTQQRDFAMIARLTRRVVIRRATYKEL